MLDADPPDDLETMRDILLKVCWDLAYHEANLPLAHCKAANIHTLLERAGLRIEPEEAKQIADTVGEEEYASNVHEYAACLQASAADSIAYHEAELRKGYVAVAAAKALMLRARLDLPFEEIMAEQRKRADDA